MMDKTLSILEALGGKPATSFHEGLVAESIMAILSNAGIKHEKDSYGNIISKVLGSDRGGPAIAFVAHMDHPGFEIVSCENSYAVASPLGGVPLASLEQSTRAFSFNSEGERVYCRLDPNPEGDERTVKVISESPLKLGAPITFDLGDFHVDHNYIRMRALDDLGGCAAILSSLEELKNLQVVNDVYGIFTRAEEVGLIGARLLAGRKTIPHDTFIVSVETSSVIPGVAQGSGPVIRTGDASYTFDADAEQVLIKGRENIRKETPDFQCQRQLMSAGSCEASAFAVNGYRTTGIAFPLGNWHNATSSITDKGGGVGEEYISLNDFKGGTRLIVSSALSVSEKYESFPPALHRQISLEYRKRLKSCDAEI